MLISFLFTGFSLSDDDEEAAFPLLHTLDFHDSVLSLDVSVVDNNLSDGASSGVIWEWEAVGERQNE